MPGNEPRNEASSPSYSTPHSHTHPRLRSLVPRHSHLPTSRPRCSPGQRSCGSQAFAYPDAPMRATSTYKHSADSPSGAVCVARVRTPRSVTWCAGLALLGVLVVSADARADARGACVEQSATSAPTLAPLALDADRAAWVSGRPLTGVALGLRLPAGRSNPAWCDAEDGAQCDPGHQAPVQQEQGSTSGAGLALFTTTQSGAAVVWRRVCAHPPINVGGGALGTRRALERPPR